MKKSTLVFNIIETLLVLIAFGYGLYLFNGSLEECNAWDDRFSKFITFVICWMFGLSICRLIGHIWSDRK